MSSSLPPEILDIIVDHLYDESATLKACCVVSKSWVPRARRHLFFQVKISSVYPIKLWMEEFPDPLNSPAHYYARVLLLWELTSITAAGTYARDWIQSFCHIVELQVSIPWQDSQIQLSLVSLHGLFPSLKSLSLLTHHYSVPLSEISGLICSFPLLEDLRLHITTKDNATGDGWDAPLTWPKLTGSLHLAGSIRPITRTLLGLPGGLCFSKISISCPADDSAGLVMDLVSKCYDTLESLRVDLSPQSPSRIPPQIDLSQATRLRDLEFQLNRLSVGWVIAAIRTAKPQNLRQITIYSHVIIAYIGKKDHPRLRELDLLLVQLWTSHSIIPRFTFRKGGSDRRGVVPRLLPELASRGFVNVVGSR